MNSILYSCLPFYLGIYQLSYPKYFYSSLFIDFFLSHFYPPVSVIFMDTDYTGIRFLSKYLSSFQAYPSTRACITVLLKLHMLNLKGKQCN